MKHGIVTSVKRGAQGRVLLTIQSDRAGVTWQDLPIAGSHPGEVTNVQEGWHVALDECDDGLWIVVGILNKDPRLLPKNLKGKEQSIKFDSGTEISVRQNQAGDYDVTVSASGDVYLGDKESAESASKNSHVHEVTLSDGSTTTTSQPTDSGTETQVQ